MKFDLTQKFNSSAWLAVITTLGFSCGDPLLIPPTSLDAPTHFTTIDDVCFTIGTDNRKQVNFEDCSNPSLKGSLAFILNEQSDRVAMLQLATYPPSMIDIDTSIPGTSHLVVGRLPVDIAIAPEGAAAYVLNQLDRTISIIDTSGISTGKFPRVLDTLIQVPGIPIALEIQPTSGDILSIYDSPSQLDIIDSWTACTDGACTITPSENRKTLSLPGTVSDFEISKDGKIGLISYRDLDRLSQITFDGTCLDPAQTAPCIEKEISLNFGCADGLDNDGDGDIDSQDEQCFGPRGAESAAGNGRLNFGACSDGMDNDGDGLLDREDPECVFSHGQTEDSNVFLENPTTPCNDGIDNDGDGDIDAAQDLDCYGSFGRSESTLPQRGVGAISIDPLGIIAYAVDRVNNEIKVINIGQGQLIDVARSTLPTFESFVSTPGIRVGLSPLDVSALVFRRVNADSVLYSIGAWVGIDNGQLQYIDALQVSCDLKTDLESAYITELTDAEKDCLVLPSFPLPDQNARLASGDSSLPEDCPALGDDAYCQRAYKNGERVAIFNPRFSLADTEGNPGRAIGNRNCEQPPEIVESMEEFASKNPRAPQQFKCDSPLMPQPVALSFLADGLDSEEVDVDRLIGLDRATILTRKTVLAADEIEELTLDQSLDSENWTITYEGVIPSTSRKDGLFDTDSNGGLSVSFQSGVNPCNAGVEVGDILIVTSESTCEAFQNDKKDFLSFEISEIQSASMTLVPLSIEGESFSANVPDRSCFDTAIEFEIRARNAWTVVGDDTGMTSKNTSLFGECIPVFGDATRRNGRVRTGERYTGPYLSFDLYPGFGGEEIPPVRDLSYTFTVDRNFVSLQYDTIGSFPSNVKFLPNVRTNSSYLVSTDPEGDFIYLRNLQRTDEPISRLR